MILLCVLRFFNALFHFGPTLTIGLFQRKNQAGQIDDMLYGISRGIEEKDSGISPGIN